ncbi:MAG: dynamin family protein [Terriglobales bacterium]
MKFELADVIRLGMIQARKNQNVALECEYQTLLARLAEDQFNIAVVGQFNRGKTSLMNAVLGTDCLPTGIVPLTSAITVVRYGSKERLLIHFQGSRLRTEAVISELPAYVTQTGNPGNTRKVQYAEVQLPVEILRRGFFFVDTPGLGSAIEANTQTTQRFLPEMDALVFITSFESPLSSEELAFLDRARQQFRRIFFVVNKADLVSLHARQQVLQFVRDRLIAVGCDINLLPVSATDALRAKLSGDGELLEQSGLPRFEQELVDFLMTDKASAFLVRMCDRLSSNLEMQGRNSGTPELVSRTQQMRERLVSGSQYLKTAGRIHAVPQDSFPPLKHCILCSKAVEQVFAFLSRYQYELSINEQEQHKHANGGGFCRLHTWQYATLASPRGICTAYPVLLQTFAQELQKVAAEADTPPEMSAQIGELLVDSKGCKVCQMQAAAEESATLEIISADGAGASPTLCIPHLRLVLGRMTEGNRARELIQRTAMLCERTAENMQRFVLKQDALRRDLVDDDERLAYEQALVLAAGHRRAATTWETK